MAVPSSIQRIKPFPPAMIELLHRIPLPPGDERYFADLVKHEPAVYVQIAQVATKSGLCTAEEASSAESITAKINPAALAGMAITISVQGYMQHAFEVPEDRGYWRYTFACAVCCEELAVPGKGDGLLAYVAGLLHDMGRLALIQAYPERYANLLRLTNRMFATEEPFDILQHERMLFGLDHFATGVWLADTWKLPLWLRPLVGKFDDRTVKKDDKLLATVRAGTKLAHSLGFGYLQAAPRMEVGAILNQFPAAQDHWKALDVWKNAEEYMRSKIQMRLKWYANQSSPEP
jgi:hypothetical protein